MTAEAKTSPKRPGRRLGMNDPEVLAMFNELAKMRYPQHRAEEEVEKKWRQQQRRANAVPKGTAKLVSDEQDAETCPVCKKEMCEKHLLALFDGDKAEGEFGMGLVGGSLCGITEIGELWEQVCLTWVRSASLSGNPAAPKWILKEPLLRSYYDDLSSVHGFSVNKYTSDDDAAHDLRVDFDDIYYTTEFLDEVSSRCGWCRLITNNVFDDRPMMSTTYLSWWDTNPQKIADRVRDELGRILALSR